MNNGNKKAKARNEKEIKKREAPKLQKMGKEIK